MAQAIEHLPSKIQTPVQQQKWTHFSISTMECQPQNRGLGSRGWVGWAWSQGVPSYQHKGTLLACLAQPMLQGKVRDFRRASNTEPTVRGLRLDKETNWTWLWCWIRTLSILTTQNFYFNYSSLYLLFHPLTIYRLIRNLRGYFKFPNPETSLSWDALLRMPCTHVMLS
jgi:hypothetical protein